MATRRPHPPGRGSLPRCLAVWAVASLTLTTLLRALAADLQAAARMLEPDQLGRTPFDVLLAGGCAVVLAGCAVWAWLGVSAVVVEAVTGRRRLARGCPAALRRAVLTACGVALLAAPLPAHAAEGHDGRVAAASNPGIEERGVLAGLPLPDRPTGPAQRTAPPPRLAARSAWATREVRVAPGDTLWALAARDLPPGASPAAVDRHWRLLWRVNRDAVGPDPDLIQPGIILRLPPREDA